MIPNGFPRDVLTRTFDRIQVQSFDIGQQYVVDGIGLTSSWRESAIAPTNSRWASFTIPVGVYCALDFRLINSEIDHVRYRVYPQGTFTLDQALDNDVNSYARNRNLRQNSLNTPVVMERRDMDSGSAVKPNPVDFIVQDDIFGAELQGNKFTGALSPSNTFLLLSPDQVFLLEIFNDGSNTGDTVVDLNYAFVPESIVPDGIL